MIYWMVWTFETAVSKHIQNSCWEKLFIDKTTGFSDDDVSYNNKKSCIQM